MNDKVNVLNENSQLTEINNKILNEMKLNVKDHLPDKVELSIYYPKLKQQLRSEIFNFCREKIELKEDLNMFRMLVGEYLDEKDIREYLDTLKEKYNNKNDTFIGIDYHIEATRIDYGVAVFVMIKRSDCDMKKFVFRFRKKDLGSGIANLSTIGTPLDALRTNGGE